MSSTRKDLLMAFGDYREYVHVDPDDGKVWMLTAQNCDGIVEDAKRISEETPSSKEFRHVAKIPFYVLDRSFREGWFHDQEKWRQWGNDGDNAAFRTWKGRL